MKLFPYQRRAIENLIRLFKRKRSVLLVSPTSSGKTVMAVRFLKKYPKQRVLWVTHRLFLLRQAREQLIAAGIPEADIGIFTGVEKTNPGARVLLASVEMWRTRELPAGIKWIVIDEAHRAAAASYRAIVDEAPKARLLGLTATPSRMDRSPLGDLFEDLLVASTPTFLMHAGFLPTPKCYGIEKGRAKAIAKSLKVGSGDYTPASATKGMRTMYGDIIAEVKRLTDGRQTIVFAVDRAHGYRLLRRFVAAGFTAEYIDGDTEDRERTAIIDRLTSGETQVVINVEVLCEGFDCPPVKCVVLARPTRSLTRMLQQCGRAGRRYNGQTPIIIDSAGNFARFPLPDFDYEWSLTDDGVLPEKSGSAPRKTCCNGKCRRLIAASYRECPHCGQAQPVAERELQEERARLIELRRTEQELGRRRTVLAEIAQRRGAVADSGPRCTTDARSPFVGRACALASALSLSAATSLSVVRRSTRIRRIDPLGPVLILACHTPRLHSSVPILGLTVHSRSKLRCHHELIRIAHEAFQMECLRAARSGTVPNPILVGFEAKRLNRDYAVIGGQVLEQDDLEKLFGLSLEKVRRLTAKLAKD